MRWRYLLLAAALAACSKTPDTTPTTRPEWRGAAINGIAPLMSPGEVAAALALRGYRQVPCIPTDKLLPDPLERGQEMPCYESPRSTLRIKLYFLELPEGRRLAVANFYRGHDVVDGNARIAGNRAYAQRLRRRFGPPSYVDTTQTFKIVYWFRPGGQPLLRDSIKTEIDRHAGANVSLTSMWAYAQARQRPAE